MLDKNQKIEVSAEDLAVIESALQTQSKILMLQAGAGASSAHEKLNDVKRLLAQLAHNQRSEKKPCGVGRGASWFSRARLFG